MGTYLNPGNTGFERILKNLYIDKTGIIGLLNETINSYDNLTCISRPRRFGKSFSAQAICAYYDCTCDSHSLFDDKEISKTEHYEEHINKYNIIYLDMSNILGNVGPENLVSFIKDSVTKEILNTYGNVEIKSTFDQTLINVVEADKHKFIMIIDEWDAPIRETPKITREYLLFLRTLFNGSGTTAKIFAAVYMTGILPIKKDGSESAVSDFNEYSVIEADKFAPYMGFTESEVEKLCEINHMDFNEAEEWYDGYTFGSCHSIYNPYSVMQAMKRKKYKSYWRKTSKAESLKTYVNMNMDGLQDKVVRLIAGEPIEVYTEDFENDFKTFNSSDDVLTLMIHLGYLAYDYETSLVRIPNEELRMEFKRLLKSPNNKRLCELVAESEKLFRDTLNMDETTVVL
ncbi:MAG: AAA family ATPase [Lachnospiraceae bacterium]|nr:AAA family ATPase [Lachnospiraceae bacterium]